jgi:hypothetical protein
VSSQPATYSSVPYSGLGPLTAVVPVPDVYLTLSTDAERLRSVALGWNCGCWSSHGDAHPRPAAATSVAEEHSLLTVTMPHPIQELLHIVLWMRTTRRWLVMTSSANSIWLQTTSLFIDCVWSVLRNQVGLVIIAKCATSTAGADTSALPSLEPSDETTDFYNLQLTAVALPTSQRLWL